MHLLAAPRPLEVVDCAEHGGTGADDARGGWRPAGDAEFAIEADRARGVAAAAAEALAGRLRPYAHADDDPTRLAAAAARTLSGVALWPALVLDERGEVVVRARGPAGEPKRSHWQTVLALAAAPRGPIRLEPGATVRAQLSYEATARVDATPQYELRASWAS